MYMIHMFISLLLPSNISCGPCCYQGLLQRSEESSLQASDFGEETTQFFPWDWVQWSIMAATYIYIYMRMGYICTLYMANIIDIVV